MKTNQPYRQPINGILLLNKPSGITSNVALQKVKRLYNAKKAGHGGCLDPLATGMLVIGFGSATKMLQSALDSNKEYIVEAQLGVKTTTGDKEGEVVKTSSNTITRAQLLAALKKFTGEIAQLPPMYSALKKDGRPLYKLARAGIEVERKQRLVMIHSIELLDLSSASFILKIACSKGTYIRTLVEDIAESLGTCAHVSQLHRTKSGEFTAAQMCSLEQLEQWAADASLTSKLLDNLVI